MSGAASRMSFIPRRTQASLSTIKTVMRESASIVRSDYPEPPTVGGWEGYDDQGTQQLTRKSSPSAPASTLPPISLACSANPRKPDREPIDVMGARDRKSTRLNSSH